MSFSGKFVRVSIIVLLFANCEINSSYCDCKVVIHMKIAKQFLPKENLIRPNYIFPPYILISFIRCLLFQKKYFLYPKLRQRMQKMLRNSQKNIFLCDGVKASYFGKKCPQLDLIIMEFWKSNPIHIKKFQRQTYVARKPINIFST